jgi:hypothetical protein
MWDELDEKLGFPKYQEGSPKTGWLVNMVQVCPAFDPSRRLEAERAYSTADPYHRRAEPSRTSWSRLLLYSRRWHDVQKYHQLRTVLLPRLPSKFG